jgi:hypothetical protein
MEFVRAGRKRVVMVIAVPSRRHVVAMISAAPIRQESAAEATRVAARTIGAAAKSVVRKAKAVVMGIVLIPVAIRGTAANAMSSVAIVSFVVAGHASALASPNIVRVAHRAQAEACASPQALTSGDAIAHVGRSSVVAGVSRQRMISTVVIAIHAIRNTASSAARSLLP